MSEPLRHVPHPWEAGQRNWRNVPVVFDWYVTGDKHESFAEDEDTGEAVPDGTCCTSVAVVPGNATSAPLTEHTARLIALAPTAPHDCADPTCPGAVNQRKLAAFDAMLAALKKLSATLDVLMVNAPTAVARAEAATKGE